MTPRRTTRTIVLAGLAGLTVTLSACGSSGESADSKAAASAAASEAATVRDLNFIDGAVEDGMGNYAQDYLREAAKAVCTAFDKGKAGVTVTMEVAGQMHVTVPQAAKFLDLSAQLYCPKYVDNFPYGTPTF